MARVLDALNEEYRCLDVVGSFAGCIQKEMHGGGTPSMESIDYREIDIQSQADRIGVPIYIYEMIQSGENGDLRPQWTKYKPSVHRDAKCRYYITLFRYEKRFDRITPNNGCNCGMDPPLLGIGNRDIFLIPVETSHNPRLEMHLKDIPNTPENVHNDPIRCPIMAESDELYDILERPDMANRVLDQMNAKETFYACLSKSIFGTEKHDEYIKNLILMEMTSNDIYRNFFFENLDIDDVHQSMLIKTCPVGEHTIFAAATLLQVDILVLVFDGTSTYWKEYGQKRRIQAPTGFPTHQIMCAGEYYITLLQDPLGNFWRIVQNGNFCNCEYEKPTPGLNLLFTEDATCHPSEGHQRDHVHLGNKRENEIRCAYHNATDPLIVRVLAALAVEYRCLDVVGSLEGCIQKEIHGGGTPSMQSIDNREIDIQSQADRIGVPIYIYEMIQSGENGDLKPRWTKYKPSVRRDVICRYYITLYRYRESSTERFDRITPNNGCNCRMEPPLLSIDVVKEDYRNLQTAYYKMQNALNEYLGIIDCLIIICNQIIDTCEGHRSNINKTVIGGTSAGIVGGILAIVGVALIPVTVGASTGLLIAGGVVGGVGGATSAGSHIFELANTKMHEKIIKRLQQLLQERLDESNAASRLYQEALGRFSSNLPTREFNVYLAKYLEKLPCFSRGVLSVGNFIPLIVARLATRITSVVVGAIIAGVGIILDVGIMIHAIFSLHSGNRTSFSESLRLNVQQLHALRQYMDIYMFGNVNTQ